MTALRTPSSAAGTTGSNPTTSHISTPARSDANLPGINGRIDEAYIASQDGSAVSAISAQDATGWVYLKLEFSYSVSGGPS